MVRGGGFSEDRRGVQMARPKKYTAKKLKKAVDKYFDSICIERPVIVDGEQVYNDEFKPIMVPVYYRPPGKVNLCLALGIDRRTWLNYSDPDKYPEFAEVTSYANTRIEAWLEEEINTRDKPQGIKFNLESNFGWGSKTEISIEKETREAIKGATMEEKLAAIAAAAAFIPKDDDDD